MTTIIERSGAAFLRAFAALFFFALIGIINAPDEQAAVALGWAALAAAIAAGLRAVQVVWAGFSFSSLGIPQPYAAWLDSFTRAFVGVFLTAAFGWLDAPDMTTWKSVLLAAVIGGVTAGIRAVQGALTFGESPAPQKGLGAPPAG